MHADVPTDDRYVNQHHGAEKGPLQPAEGKSYNVSWSNFLGGADEWVFGSLTKYFILYSIHK